MVDPKLEPSKFPIPARNPFMGSFFILLLTIFRFRNTITKINQSNEGEEYIKKSHSREKMVGENLRVDIWKQHQSYEKNKSKILSKIHRNSTVTGKTV